MTEAQLYSALQGAIGLAPIDAHQTIKSAINDFLLDSGHQMASIKFVEAMAWAEPEPDAPINVEF
jgi:hypothetical protein